MVNRTVLQGRLTADPELKTTQSGVSFCGFRVAWSEKYKETETKLFLSCMAWRGTAELLCKYFRKGQEIVVEGKLHTEEWTDKEGGRRSDIKMTVDQVHFCGPKTSEGSNAPHAAGAPVTADASDFQELDDDGELPF